MKKYAEHKFDNNFLKQMCEFYDNIDENRTKIKNRDHVKAVFANGRRVTGGIEMSEDQDNNTS